MRSSRLSALCQAFLVVTSIFCCSPLFAALLEDPGFEQQYPPLWNLSSGAYINNGFAVNQNYPLPHSGNRMLRLEVRYDAAANNPVSASQTLTAAVGQQWTFSGYMINFDGAAAMQPLSYGLLEIVFNGTYGERRFGSDHLTPAASGQPDNWLFSSLSATAPEGTEHVTVFLKNIQGAVPETFYGSGYGSLWFDDVNLTVVEAVPEPASAGCLAVMVIAVVAGGRHLWERRR